MRRRAVQRQAFGLWPAAAPDAAGDRLAVVTGAGSGIGRALMVALTLRGLRVVGVGRRKDALQQSLELAIEAASERSLEARPEVLCADVSSEEGRESVVLRMADLVAEKAATLSYVVHNAGTIGEIAPPESISLLGFRDAMATNVEGPLFLTQGLAPLLGQATDGGRVLHISTGAAHGPLAGSLGYCTSKAALLQMMRCLDLELQPRIRVGSAMPGIVNTEMQAALRGKEFPAAGMFREFFANAAQGSWRGPGRPPAGGLDHPENVADFLAWLLLDVHSDDFGGHEWDINDREHQQRWLQARRVI